MSHTLHTLWCNHLPHHTDSHLVPHSLFQTLTSLTTKPETENKSWRRLKQKRQMVSVAWGKLNATCFISLHQFKFSFQSYNVTLLAFYLLKSFCAALWELLWHQFYQEVYQVRMFSVCWDWLIQNNSKCCKWWWHENNGSYKWGH